MLDDEIWIRCLMLSYYLIEMLLELLDSRKVSAMLALFGWILIECDTNMPDNEPGLR